MTDPEDLLEDYEMEGKLSLENKGIARVCLCEICDLLGHDYLSPYQKLLKSAKLYEADNIPASEIESNYKDAWELHDAISEDDSRERKILRAIICALVNWQKQHEIYDSFIHCIDFCTMILGDSVRLDIEKLIRHHYE